MQQEDQRAILQLEISQAGKRGSLRLKCLVPSDHPRKLPCPNTSKETLLSMCQLCDHSASLRCLSTQSFHGFEVPQPSYMCWAETTCKWCTKLGNAVFTVSPLRTIHGVYPKGITGAYKHTAHEAISKNPAELTTDIHH